MAAAISRRMRESDPSVCDLQEKFRNAIWQFDKVINTSTKLLKAAHTLQIPIYVTTQNRARLGDTVHELQPYLTNNTPLLKADEDKTRFSMWLPAIASQFSPASAAHQKAQIAIVGIESHICVTQTALDALAAGHEVYVIADGVSSCNREEVPVALARLAAAGATVTTSESWLYECMGDAGVGEFRDIVKLVKETGGTTKEALQGLLGGERSKM
ncbi:isochorismatase [Coniochaeta sp. 2T2.1]|nr:isochorismatase [Coniochaeta sp. 2T2.1]